MSTRFKPREPIPLLRIVITGSRRWRAYRVMYARLEQLDPRRTRLYTGGARGADLMALRIAEKLSIPLTEVLAEWQKLDKDGRFVFDKRGGMIRNGWLLDKLQPDSGDYVLAFRWPGTSPGTDGMIAMARQRGISVEVVTPDILA